MNCPSCRSSLHKMTKSGIDFFVCRGCDGIWVSDKQLQMLALMISEISQPDDSFRFTLKTPDIQSVPEKTETRICPECSTPMKEINFAYDSNVMIDKCPTCKGVWLDQNEIYAIAKHVQYKPEAELMGAAICDFRNKLDELKDKKESAHDVDSVGIIRSAKIITAAIVHFLS